MPKPSQAKLINVAREIINEYEASSMKSVFSEVTRDNKKTAISKWERLMSDVRTKT